MASSRCFDVASDAPAVARGDLSRPLLEVNSSGSHGDSAVDWLKMPGRSTLPLDCMIPTF